MKFSLLFVLVFIVAHAMAQDYELSNARGIDEDRYDGIEGDPMFFKDWVIGTVITSDARVMEGIELNYNGYSGSVEVKRGDEMIELDPKRYLRMEVTREQNPGVDKIEEGSRLAFQRGLDARFGDDFIIVLFGQPELMLLKEFQVDIAEHVVQNVGKTERFQMFNRKYVYYVKRGKTVSVLRLKKKTVLQELDEPQLNDYVKSERLDLTKESDVLQLFEYYYNLKMGAN